MEDLRGSRQARLEVDAMREWAGEDPLALDRFCSSRRREAALMIDHDRLVSHVLAGLRGSEDQDLDFEERLEGAVQLAVRRILWEDQVRLDGDSAQARSDYGFIMQQLPGHGPEDARAACLSFNGLPDKARHLFFLVFVDGCRVSAAAEQFDLGSEEARRLLTDSLTALGWGGCEA